MTCSLFLLLLSFFEVFFMVLKYSWAFLFWASWFSCVKMSWTQQLKFSESNEVKTNFSWYGSRSALTNLGILTSCLFYFSSITAGISGVCLGYKYIACETIRNSLSWVMVFTRSQDITVNMWKTTIYLYFNHS